MLKEHEAGDLARKHGISEAAIYNWKVKFSGVDVSEAKRPRALEEENVKLKKLLAEQMLDAAAPRELPSKNGRARRQARCCRASAGRHEAVGTACSIVGADRRMIRYCSSRPPDAALRGRLRDLANERRRFG